MKAMGQRFGRYEVLDKIGAGGMGEVYRARDSELKRDVAIKVLRDRIQSNPEHQKRFLQEARSASALNHPNIVTVHDIGSEDGVSYIVSEFVEGQSLRSQMAGTISVRKVIDMAVQIASALAAAHRAGIVHRDLKPENIMIAPDGRVKLLDFGLAKWLERDSSEDQETFTELVSKEGIIRGTVPYMSPEQAAGSTIDFRSDQFSFGVILYEMLTGKRPFDRATQAQTLSAIIDDDPPPVASLNPNVPPPLRWLIERCLAKEPSQRYDSSGDLYRDVLEMQQHLSEVVSSEALPQRPQRRLRFSTWILLALPLAIIAGIFWGRSTSRTAPPVFHRLTFRRGFILRPRFGGDGKTVYYSAVWDVGDPQAYVTRVDNPETSPLPYPRGYLEAVSDTGEISMNIDPDRTNLLAVASLAGGALRQISTGVEFSDWSPANHQLLIAHRVNGRVRLEFPPGKVLYDPGPNKDLVYIRFSPKGDKVGFVQGDEDQGIVSVCILNLDGKVKVLSSGWSDVFGLAWVPKGNEIWFSSRKLGETSGGLILRGVDLSGHVRAVAGIPGMLIVQDISKDGRVLATHQSWPSTMMCAAPQQTTERDLSWFDQSTARLFSRDGKKIVFREDGIAGGAKGLIFMRDTDGNSPAVRLGEGRALSLSADGRWLLADVAPYSGICTLIPTGAGESRNISTGNVDCLLAQWLSDNQRFVFLGREKQTKSYRWYLTDINGKQPRPVTPVEDGLETAVLSSDDRMIVWKNELGELVEYKFDSRPSTTLSWKLTANDRLLAFNPDENAAYVANGREVVQVYRYAINTGTRELWKEMGPVDRVGVNPIDVVIAPKANAYCYSFVRSLSDLYEVQGLK